MASRLKNRIRVIIVGACGRMGTAISEKIEEEKDLEIIYGIEKRGHPNIGLPFGKNFITDGLKDVIKEGDVVVDFSEVAAVMNNREILRQGKKPYICGVTGFQENEFKALKELGRYFPFLYSPNFSFGVNILFRMIREIADKFPKEYDVKVIETHHKMKRDAPSGTAKRITEIIEKERKSKVEVFSLRLGEIVGEHKVIFAGPGEVLEISHSALSRQAFVRGVIEGIRFIVKQPNGFYTFEDMLKWQVC